MLSHCRGQAEPLGWLSLLHFAQLYELIWLNACIREEDWPKPQLGILLAPVSLCSPLIEPSPRRWVRKLVCFSEVVCLHHQRSAAAWNWNTSRPNRLPFSASLEGIYDADLTASPNSSRRLVYFDNYLFYKFKTTVHKKNRKESFQLPLPTILAVLVWKQMLYSVLRTSPCFTRETLPSWGPRSTCFPLSQSTWHHTELVSL